MKRLAVVAAVVLSVALLSGTRIRAHHSFAEFYFESQSVSIAGEVLEFEYRNPHTWLHVLVEDENGESRRYSAEWSNPNALRRSGITAETLRPGDYVVVTGSPGRNPEENNLHLKGIERPADGWEWTGREGRTRRRGRR